MKIKYKGYGSAVHITSTSHSASFPLFLCFSSTMSTAGEPYGQYLDRQGNPVANQGAVMANAAYDIGARVAIQMDNQNNAQSMYDGSGDPGVWNIAPHSLCFTVPGVHGSLGDSRLQILDTVNGLGSVASMLNPDDKEAVRQAAKNQIQFIGVNYQALSAERNNVERGVAIQLGGLHTLPIGNGEYGDDKDSDTVIRPGDMLAWEMPEPGPNGRKLAGGRPRKGIPANKYILQVRKASSLSSAHALLHHVSRVVRDPAVWRKSMGEHLAGTNAWHSAVKNVIHSYFTGVSLAVGALVDGGYLLRGLGLPAGIASGNDVAIAVAKLLGVIDGNTTKQAKDMQLALARRIFHAPEDIATEFGTSRIPNGPMVYAGRISAGQGRGRVDTSKEAGKLLLEQLNHFTRGVAAFDNAVLRNHATIIGKATTGGSAQGTGNVHVYLGHHGS